MKKPLFMIIPALIAMIAFSGCRADELPPSEEIQVTSEAENAEYSLETGTGTEKEISGESEAPDNVSQYKGQNDFYIKVTDCNGEEKLLFYMCGDEENNTIVYMEEMMDDPEMHFGYMSMVSHDLPAKAEKAAFGEQLQEISDQSGMGYAAISYFYADNGFASSSKSVDTENQPQRFEKLMESVFSFVPEYVPELASEQDDRYGSVNTVINTFDDTVKGNYDMRYPLTSLNIYPLSVDHTPTIISPTMASRYSIPSINFSFSRYGDRTICRMKIYDYREIQKLILSEDQPPTPEELEKAYYASTYYVSDWFYADNTEFYDYALKCVLLSDKNEFPNVKQNRTDKGYDSRSGFSENIAAYLNTSGEIPDGYEAVQFKDIYFIIPNDGQPLMTDGLMYLWKNNDEGEISLRISQNSSATTWDTKLVSEHGKFNNEYCSYYSHYNSKQQYYYDEIDFKDPNGKGWTAMLKLDSAERTDEYDALVKNVLGSLSLYDPERKTEDAKIKLASEPSVYADTSELAESYSYSGNDVYKAYRPGIIFAYFYVLDWNNNYKSGFECFLEKQEPDGLWYKVEPLGGGMTQVNNGSGPIYNVFDTGRDFVLFDLAAYPLLPPGKYRIVKPFWNEESSDHEQYMAFYEFRMDEKIYVGDEITGSAHCEQNGYSANTAEISYTVETKADSFVISDIADIEKLENGEWVSVRTSPVKTNSIGGSYALRFSGMKETISTKNFDISEPGEYRIRISVGEYDITTDEDMFTDNYDTIYAYFSIV